jgi:hypothetical protein
MKMLNRLVASPPQTDRQFQALWSFRGAMETGYSRPANRSVLKGFRRTFGKVEKVFLVSSRRTRVAESAPALPDPTRINTEGL